MLMSLDMSKTAKKGDYHVPVAWVKEYGQGKAMHMSLGHREDVWENPTYMQSMLGGVKWILGMEPGDATPNPELSSAQEAKAKADFAAAKEAGLVTEPAGTPKPKTAEKKCSRSRLRRAGLSPAVGREFTSPNKTTPDRDRLFPTRGVLLLRAMELADDSSLDGGFGRLAGADANHIGQRGHEDLAVTDLARPGAVHDRVDHSTDVFVRNDDFDLHLGNEIDSVLGTAVGFGVALLTAEPTNLGDGHSLDSALIESVLDGFQLEMTDDSFNLLHDYSPLSLVV